LPLIACRFLPPFIAAYIFITFCPCFLPPFFTVAFCRRRAVIPHLKIL
jgi:hypothetical protein